MSYKIAIAGKGGTGKTSLTGLIIDYLVKKGNAPILAVDADANSNLNEVLGEELGETIGEIREEVNKAEASGSGFPGGMVKAQYLQYRLGTAVAEGNGYDMLVMGRSQGEGCYCYVNGILKTQLESLSNNYKYMIIDNEAGMEHISRGTVKNIDTLILVSDCSTRGIQAAGRIKKLAHELKIEVSKAHLIVNRAPSKELNKKMKEEIERQNLDLLGIVPIDSMIYEFDSSGKPLINLPEASLSKTAVRDIMKKIGL